MYRYYNYLYTLCLGTITCTLVKSWTLYLFMCRYYNYLYTHYSSPLLTERVDAAATCHDILMNFLVSHVTRRPPIKLTQRKHYRQIDLPASNIPGTSLSLSLSLSLFHSLSLSVHLPLFCNFQFWGIQKGDTENNCIMNFLITHIKIYTHTSLGLWSKQFLNENSLF